MSMEGRSKYLHQVASKLRIALGREARHLVKVIPNLGFILGGESADQHQGQDCANAQSRIQYLLCQLVDVISSSSGAPIVLFLDDLQWSDRASISAINQLLVFVRHSVQTSLKEYALKYSVLIEALESKIDTPLIEPLHVAIAEGIIDKIDGSYSFGHDKLQEAAYNLMLPEDRCLFHSKFGLALVHRQLDLIDDGMLFTAASQINLGGPAAINNAEQSVQMASLNLTVGTKAMEMSDFSSAYSFFDHEISFLKKRHWQEHYDLSLQLFECASICALAKGDVVSLTLLSDQILRFAKRFEDKLNTMFDKVTVLTYTSKLPESVSMAISVLSQLGIELPETSESDLKT
ncbi:hypothetical protein ACHAW5_002047 [Stephanodiscus triporus]|uniref:Orc1-like AAA ATPase domain-containing protein n=1 Tax=Stephanodiscus triporus TaxID=2934178 RepID=A0ABD3QLY1_9STRA